MGDQLTIDKFFEWVKSESNIGIIRTYNQTIPKKDGGYFKKPIFEVEVVVLSHKKKDHHYSIKGKAENLKAALDDLWNNYLLQEFTE